MLFSLLQNPCSANIYVIWKETHSLRWTAMAIFWPGDEHRELLLTAQFWRLAQL